MHRDNFTSFYETFGIKCRTFGYLASDTVVDVGIKSKVS
jgi:hypothetical protein